MNDSLRLVEESLALLRRAPASAWAAYLAGAAPYGVGLIWFWLETTRSAYARQNIAFTSAAMALLFIWKQVFEALFLARLRALLGGKSAGGDSLPSLIARQAAVQPSAFLVIPLAIAATFPLPQALLFYRQFSLGSTMRQSLDAARFGGTGPLWTLTGVAALGGLLLYLNLLVAAVFAAQFAVNVLGVESLEIGVVALLSNTTVHFTVGVMVYLALDLMLDAAAALQAFRAVSVRTGEDILAALASLAILLVLLTATPALAQQPPDTQALDQAIERTLHQPEFAWRLEPAAEGLPPFIGSMLDAARAAGRWLEEAIKALDKWLTPDRRDDAGEGRSRSGSPPNVRLWLLLLGLAAAIALSVLVIRSRRRKPVREQTEAAAAAVDVRDESVLASSLAEDEWLRMAERYLSQGEPRLALRALHLACLRMLAERGMIAVTRSKTGMDYLDEVRRRARQSPALAERFGDNVWLFELGWYSLHPVNAEMVDSYRQGLEQIRAYGA